MKIVLCVVGKTTTDYIRKGVEEYAGRIGRFMPFDIRIIPDIKSSKKLSIQAQKDAEGLQILSQLTASDYVVLLDERGREFTSRGFSEFIEQKAQTVQKNLVFIIGGPYGFSQTVYDRADMQLSLSKMTFPHELIRIFITEQIYRALSISHNLPYHHD